MARLPPLRSLQVSPLSAVRIAPGRVVDVRVFLTSVHTHRAAPGPTLVLRPFQLISEMLPVLGGLNMNGRAAWQDKFDRASDLARASSSGRVGGACYYL